jgi:phage-related protein
MIVYDGVSLDMIPKLNIEDIRVSPIQYSQETRPRAILGGSEFIRNRAASRTVAVTFALLDDNKNSRQISLMRISEWAKTDKEYELTLPFYPDRHLLAVCTGKPEPSMRQWWESKLRLVFTCIEDPYWRSNYERQAACGSRFFAQGDAPPLMRIERTVTGSAVINQSYSLDGRTMTFSTLPVGTATIDLDKQLASSVNGSTVTDLMQYYNVNSKFLIPRPGTMIISGTGTVKYRERWQ